MGAILRDAGDWEGAAEDFLSAADCYLQAAHGDKARTTLEQARQMSSGKGIEASRPDLGQILKEREEELQNVQQKEQSILDSFSARGFRPAVPDEEALRYLLQAVRELPGLAPLHWVIFLQANGLGKDGLAREHLRWAANFDPANPDYVAALGYHLLDSDEGQSAVELGLQYLAKYPTRSQVVRLILANALAPTPQARAEDREQALAILQPLIDDTGANLRQRIAALMLSTILHFESGHSAELAHMEAALLRMSAEIASDEQAQSALAEAQALIRELSASAGRAALRVHRRDEYMQMVRQLTLSGTTRLAA
jgi:hypothetical protein